MRQNSQCGIKESLKYVNMQSPDSQQNHPGEIRALCEKKQEKRFRVLSKFARLHRYESYSEIHINPKNKFERRDALWNSITAWCQKT